MNKYIIIICILFITTNGLALTQFCDQDFESIATGVLSENDPTNDIDYAGRPFWGTGVSGTTGGIWESVGNPGKTAVAHIDAVGDGGDSYSEPKFRWDNQFSNSQKIYVKFDMRIDANLGTSNATREVNDFKVLMITDYTDAGATAEGAGNWSPQLQMQPSSNTYSFYTWSLGGCYSEYYFTRAGTKIANNLMDNQWHTIEMFVNIGSHVASNKDDSDADGIVRIWEDSTLILEDISVPFRCSGDEGQGINSIAAIRHAFSTGAPVGGMNGHVYYDNIEIWDDMPNALSTTSQGIQITGGTIQ